MRPVLLEMNGFASFREQTTVDFTDADYFALVGPTGSGKSTIVDAMTFALYGSAPRWAHRTAVKFALAPTTTRATVRLLFDAGPHRYVVARELRRTSVGVQSKGSRLERLTDPTRVGGVDDLTEPIASDGGVSDAVETLLGLTFEQFCQCVVLPQGDFAQFLQSPPSDRQKILLKLLGAERYEEIARRANQRAALAEQRVNVLAEQVDELADATDDAHKEAQTRQDDLERLMGHVQVRLPELAAAAQTLTRTQANHERLTVQQSLLGAVTVPDDVPDLDARHDAATLAVKIAADQEADAQERDMLARRELQDAPARGPLEAARSHHAERATKAAQRPADVQAHSSAVSAATTTNDQVATAETALESARNVLARAREVAGAANSQVQKAMEERDLLTGPALPADVVHLADRVSRARVVATRTQTDVVAAEDADTSAQTALGDAPDRAVLLRARDLLSQLADRQARIPTLKATYEKASTAAGDAERAVTDASERVKAAADAVHAARQANAAAVLRPHLIPGEPCPVCDQAVTLLPTQLDAPEVAVAEATLRAEQAQLAGAQKAHVAGQLAQSAAAGAVSTENTEIDRLLAAIPDGPRDVAGVDDAMSSLQALDDTARTARQALQTARQQAKQAVEALTRVETAEAAAREAVRAARDPLVALGAPAVDDSDLLTAWTTLTDWAHGQATAKTEHLTAAQAQLSQAEAALHQAEGTFTARERDVSDARATQQRAMQAVEQARARLDELTRRLTELDDLLAGAPTDAAAEELLTHIAQLEAAQRQADTVLLSARTVHEKARVNLAEATAEISAGFARLRKVRDPFVALDVPELPDEGLLAAWNVLTRWAGDQSAVLSAALPGAAAQVDDARQARRQISTQLADEMSHYGLDVPDGELAGQALPVVAAALERARAATEKIGERRDRAARLSGDRDEAQKEQQVAKLLGDLLRADRFQRWLATAALDALVVDASASLMELSGGQFDLTHDKGEFYVIDHADADSKRSVRTLSGGETFQASLALALALSAHMSTLAAAGATRLDSIFLDEGFGTLDPDTLEVVATTLEGLANGERMVGVITHVAALAERVPVRYKVRRDAITSSVVRETP